MYIKISKKSQLIMLRNLNQYLGKHSMPEEVLHELGKLQARSCRRKRDYIALFMDPVKNDIMEILSGLQIYPAKAEFSDNNIYTIVVKRKKKIIWVCSELYLKEDKRKIFVIYPMKKKHLDSKAGY